ncbi:MAG: cytochrome C oxidase subunit IV family protein [Candidatus Handelsmanbacteria bacterium]|nr:cytochrome C oxidase subunit IV family protein [Candidatus Handelsmanbacteria bacterium]
MSQHHIVPLSVYFRVFALLMLMTVATVGVAYVDLGWGNTPVALAIALFKASIVILFFMHVRYNTPLMWLYAAAGFFWLLILLVLTMQDYYTRGWEGAPVEFLKANPTPF